LYAQTDAAHTTAVVCRCVQPASLPPRQSDVTLKGHGRRLRNRRRDVIGTRLQKNGLRHFGVLALCDRPVLCTRIWTRKSGNPGDPVRVCHPPLLVAGWARAYTTVPDKPLAGRASRAPRTSGHCPCGAGGVFPAGIAAANLRGFTTQNTVRVEVAPDGLSLPRWIVGKETVIHTRRPVRIGVAN
jgi:hypothetical protein